MRNIILKQEGLQEKYYLITKDLKKDSKMEKLLEIIDKTLREDPKQKY